MRKYVSRLALLWPAALVLTGCDDAKVAASPKDQAAVVTATVETAPMQDAEDAADDPAIWVDANDPANSVIIGTNKKRGLGVYGLDGKELAFRADGRMNNVDLRQDVAFGDEKIDVVVASNRTDMTIAIYRFDGPARALTPLMDAIPTGFTDVYGICLYRNVASGTLYVFANEKDTGTYGQWRLAADGDKIAAERVGTITVGSQAEGCAADDEHGVLFIAEEDVGLYAYAADPDAPGDRNTTRATIDTVANGHLTADAEGVAVVKEGESGGYVMVSSQGSNSYNVYDRLPPYAFRGAFAIGNGASIDGTQDTDGIDVTSANLGPAFPDGVFVAQDGANDESGGTKAHQNFKLVPWPEIRAALKLPQP